MMIRGETSACAQDGPSDVPKTDKGVYNVFIIVYV